MLPLIITDKKKEVHVSMQPTSVAHLYAHPPVLPELTPSKMRSPSLPPLYRQTKIRP